MADTSEKTKARLPRGFIDRSADDIRAVEAMMAKIRAVYELYGFEPVDQPLIEYTDALGKFLPDQDRPNEGVFSFQDDDEQWLSLRYDLTAPMARFVAENYERLPKPYRSYRSGWVFRNEKPGPGRFRQFMQFDADTVGTPNGVNGVAADAEMCMMMADVMEALGIARGDYVIRFSDRRIWDGLLETIGLTSEKNAGRRLTVLRAIDKLDRLGLEGVTELLGSGRKDESGDFTPGAGLKDEQRSAVMSLLHGSEMDKMAYVDGVKFYGDGGKPPFNFKMAYSADSAFMNNLRAIKEKFLINETFSNGTDSIDTLEKLVRASGYGADRIRIDGTVVRGLEYYTGPVYEAELLAEIPNEDGQIVRFGSVGGGGRYDGLVSRFRGEPVPATGFSIGVSRLMTALKNLGKLDPSTGSGPVVVLVMDRDTESLGRYQKMVAELRGAKIRAEMYLGGSGMKPQMKYADRRGSPCVVIQGGDERNAVDENGAPRPMVQIKDMVVGAELAANIAANAAYKEARPGQVTVPQADLVATVRRILDAQAKDRAP